MSSKAKLTAILVTLSLIVVVSMGVLETFLIESHFQQSLTDQLTFSAQQLAITIADLNVPAENNETCQALADSIYSNSGVRVLITDIDNTIVVDSSYDDSLVGEVIESDMIAATTESGQVNSFDLPLAGKDEIGVSAPWQTGEDISGAIIFVGPLKAYAREATSQLWPFIRRSALGALLIGAIGAYFISARLSQSGTTAANNQSVALEPSTELPQPETAEQDEIAEQNQVTEQPKTIEQTEIAGQSDIQEQIRTEADTVSQTKSAEHTEANEQTDSPEQADTAKQTDTTEQAGTPEQIRTE